MPSVPKAVTLTTRWTMLDQLGRDRAEEAWSWFVTRYRSTIRAVLARRLGGKDVDAALDEFWAYLFMHRIAARADRTRRFRTFLGAVAHNYALAWRRGRRPGTEAADAEAVWEDPPPDDEELRTWARQVLALALAELRAAHPASADVLHWFYGVATDGSEAEPLTVAEIATRTGMKPNAIHVALHRGRQRLRARVEVELREAVSDEEGLVEELQTMLAAIRTARPGLVD